MLQKLLALCHIYFFTSHSVLQQSIVKSILNTHVRTNSEKKNMFTYTFLAYVLRRTLPKVVTIYHKTVSLGLTYM